MNICDIFLLEKNYTEKDKMSGSAITIGNHRENDNKPASVSHVIFISFKKKSNEIIYS